MLLGCGRVGIGWLMLFCMLDGVTTSDGAGDGDGEGEGEGLRDDDAPPGFAFPGSR